VRRGPSGFAAWVVQRGSALYMLAFMCFSVASLTIHPRVTFQEWAGWVHGPAVSVCSEIFFLALGCHMWVGLRDVLLDYAKPASLRRVLLIALALVLVGLAGWASLILFVPGV
jgi:succinate dehydrogenase / fumarate reductase, membrane anchor subunit